MSIDEGLRDNKILPEGPRRRIKANTKKALLLSAKFVVLFDESPAQHQTTTGKKPPPE
jgi:hypothetical protein